MSNTTAPASSSVAIDTTKVPAGGSVVHTTTSSTQVPVSPPVNPLIDGSNWTGFLTLVAGIALIMGVFTKYVTGRFTDYKETHKPLHDEINRNFHSVRNDSTVDRARIHALESFRQSDVERIVRLETNQLAIERGQQRIEKTLDDMKHDGAEARAEIIQSLRELRDVRPKG